MIQELSFEQFKSFAKCSVQLSSLTVIIGSNASGKSNALDGLRILSESVRGAYLAFVLDGYRSNDMSGIRGGSKGSPRFGGTTFELGAKIGPLDDGHVLHYRLSVEVGERIAIFNESLTQIAPDESERLLFQTVQKNADSGDIFVEYNNHKRGPNPQFTCLKFASVLSQVASRLPAKGQAEKHVHEMSNLVIEQLQKVLFLEPIPHEMRDYVAHTSVKIAPTASNLSAVLSSVLQKAKGNKPLILKYLKKLPDQEILDIDTIKTPLGDVMLRVREQSGSDKFWVDARGVSDGTLRSLAIMVALLAEEPGSLVVIEEIDNGLHPSKARSILKMLYELSEKQGIRLLVTTHNPALLNAMTGKEAAGVVVCYRDKVEGDSRFEPLVDLDAYLRIVSNERIGDAMESGEITKAVRGDNSTSSDDAIAWLKSL